MKPSNVVFGINNGVDEILRDVAVAGEQRLGVIGQTIAAVAKAGVFAVHADPRVEADAVDDLACVQTMGGGAGVEFVEVGPAHGQSRCWQRV